MTHTAEPGFRHCPRPEFKPNEVALKENGEAGVHVLAGLGLPRFPDSQ